MRTRVRCVAQYLATALQYNAHRTTDDTLFFDTKVRPWMHKFVAKFDWDDFKICNTIVNASGAVVNELYL